MTLYENEKSKKLEFSDHLINSEERCFKGAYYTPLAVVHKAYDLLSETLDKNWQKKYIIWDMCCGIGNLEIKHHYPQNIYMSTLDQVDIDLMKANKICISAVQFQYDYLNDDINDNGQIDYSLTNKIPQSLQKLIKENNENHKNKNNKYTKKILILINPPYAEATNSDNIINHENQTSTKKGVSSNKISSLLMNNYGLATRELFVQFLVRIKKEIPSAILAVFSTLKYVNAPNFEKFRQNWDAEYKNGFIIHSKTFDGLTGSFPIGFLIWKIDKNRQHNLFQKIHVKVLDRNLNKQSDKIFFNIQNNQLLSEWIQRPQANKIDSIPLKNAITPATRTKDLRGTKWADHAIGCLFCQGNDIQHINQTALFSSGFGSAGAFFVTPDNLWKAAIVFSVRRLIKATWINNRDQFLQPNQILPEKFINDCLIWMLFNGSNLSASANDLDWNNQKWSIVNHFIPFTENEINATDRFESDFMVQYLKDKRLSIEAKNVLNEGKNLWKIYFSQTDDDNIRESLKLNRTDIGWYQMRKALEARNNIINKKNNQSIDFSTFKTAYDILSNELRPQVYDLGFLK